MNEGLTKEISLMRELVNQIESSQQRQEEEKSYVYQELEKLRQVLG